MRRRERKEGKEDADAARAYGTDAYWVDRYSTPGATEDSTNEWLLGWNVLAPLVRIPPRASVIEYAQHKVAI